MADVFTTETTVEKKEDSVDPAVLLKRLKDKDEYISTLEAENKTAREAAAQADISKNILEEIRNEIKKPAKVEGPQSQHTVDANEIRDLVKSSLVEAETSRQTIKNTEQVSDTLSTHFGSLDKAKEAITKAASDLGVTVQYLRDIGAKSPTALYKMLSIEPKQKVTQLDTTKSILNTNTNQQDPNVKDLAYFQQLRKTDPHKYWSVEVQAQEHKLRKSLGTT